MSKPTSKWLIIAIALLLCVLAYTFYMNRGHQGDTDLSRLIDTQKSNEPIDTDSLSMNIYETICEIGPPTAVKGWSLDPETRFVFFKGTFLPFDRNPGSQRTYGYLRMSLDTIDTDRAHNMELLDSLDDYEVDTAPSDISRFHIPMLRGVPDRLETLTDLLGTWTVSHDRKSKGFQRLVYAKKMCINGQLVEGAYFDTARGRIIKAKGIATKERLTRVINDIRTPEPDPPDKEPKRYRDHPPEEGTAEYTLIRFILLREAGKKDQAKALLSSDQENEWLRDHITSQTESGFDIDLNEFFYQAVKRTNTEVVFEYNYRLENGGLMDFGHTVVYEEGVWKVHH